MAVGPARDERRAAPECAFPLRRPARERFRLAPGKRRAYVVPGTQRARRTFRRTDCGAEIHHRLGKITATPRWGQFASQPAQLRLRSRQRLADSEQPADDALDIAIDRAGRRIEGDRGDGGGGVIADAGQRAQLRFARRKCAAVMINHRTSAGVQVASARVVTETGPNFEYVAERRGCERAHVGPASQEFCVIWRDRPHGRLLQHDLGQPNAVGVGPLAARRSPGQDPTMAVVPGEQSGWLWG